MECILYGYIRDWRGRVKVNTALNITHKIHLQHLYNVMCFIHMEWQSIFFADKFFGVWESLIYTLGFELNTFSSINFMELLLRTKLKLIGYKYRRIGLFSLRSTTKTETFPYEL